MECVADLLKANRWNKVEAPCMRGPWLIGNVVFSLFGHHAGH